MTEPKLNTIASRSTPTNTSQILEKSRQDLEYIQINTSVPGQLVHTPNANLSTRISARELHKYVVGLIGIFLLFSITYPIAMMRVSRHPKFAPYQSHVKSLSKFARSFDSY